MKKILLFHLLLVCPVVFLIWYVAFSDYVWFLECSSFFSSTSDFAEIQFSLPSDWAQYAGAYLLQFFCSLGVGALIQALFAVIVLLSADCIVARLFRNKGLLWLSFIPVVWFISGQFTDNTLVRSLEWCVISMLLALLVWLLTIRMKRQSLGERSFFSSSFFTYLVPCLLLGVVAYHEATDDKHKELEDVCRLDRWAECKDWDAILQAITPEETRQSSVRLRWALLALSEKGLLTERIFAYGVAEPACFFYERMDRPFCHNFNVQFYEALGLDNEVVHHAYQAGIQSPYGMTFRAMRTMMNAYTRQGDVRQLAKYIKVMGHTSCHGKWLESLKEHPVLAKNGNCPTPGKAVNAFFIGAHPFLSDIARMVDRYPENQKMVDYLLCGLLVSKDMDKFYQIFRRLARTTYLSSLQTLPRYYEEALILIATQHPEVLRYYPVSRQKLEEFNSFHALLKGGVMNQGMLEVNYRDSFWFYYYCIEQRKL